MYCTLFYNGILIVIFCSQLSFGFGANAGLGPSCLHKNTPENPKNTTTFRFTGVQGGENNTMLKVIMYIGWVVLLADFAFVLCCIIFLFKLAKVRLFALSLIKLFRSVAALSISIDTVMKRYDGFINIDSNILERD